MNITKDIVYVGVNDHQVDLFEGQYVVPNGMAYNSYVILDEKIAVMDTAARNMAKMLEGCKNITYTQNNVKIMSALNEDSMAQLTALAAEL